MINNEDKLWLVEAEFWQVEGCTWRVGGCTPDPTFMSYLKMNMGKGLQTPSRETMKVKFDEVTDE